jgi:hypothetical protein
MSVVHRIVGYNRHTELLEVEYDIPAERFSDVRALANVPAHDADAIGSYPIEPDAARTIARNIQRMTNLDQYDWFLEPFTDA